MLEAVVCVLVSLLSSPDSGVRALAELALREASLAAPGGPVHALVLGRLAASRCPEAKRRLCRVRDAYENVGSVPEVRFFDPQPGGDPDHEDCLEMAARNDGDFSHEPYARAIAGRFAALEYCRRLFKKGLTRKQILVIIDSAKKAERGSGERAPEKPLGWDCHGR